jgi:PhnB protein
MSHIEEIPMAINPIPQGYEGLTAYIMVRDASKAIEYYKQALGATEKMRLPMPDGKVGHAELQIGPSVLMLADECPEAQAKSPESLNGTTFAFVLYVPNVDAAFKRALDAGGKVLQALENKFYGDRAGTFVDPYGHQWCLMQHVEDVSPEEMERRMAEFSKKK